MLLFSIAACSKTVAWTEEIKLSTGQTIVIERETHHLPGGGEIFRSSGWRPELYIIRFKHDYPPRQNLEIEWRTTKWDAERVMDPEMPLVLDIDPAKKAPYIVTYHGMKGACFEYMRYVFRDGGWYEYPLPTEFEPFPANLFLAAAGLDLPKEVTLELKRKVNADTGYRQRLKQIGPKQTDCRA